jgi:hypothetical protein
MLFDTTANIDDNGFVQNAAVVAFCSALFGRFKQDDGQNARR